ncbi:MAG: cyclin-dependent kinase inhibitor 3 family protein [Rubrobacter sp.]|nr:cyclin-dependent kinase inhibitor 3 family protein [Rubrobacter sp.]
MDFLSQEVLELPGRLGLTFAPGKKTDETGGRWERDLETDLQRLRQEYGVEALVSLRERAEYSDLRIPKFFQKAEEMDMDALHLPIPDYGVPSAPEEDKYRPLIEDLAGQLEEGQTVVVHCRGGLGQRGLVAASVLVSLGHPSGEAIRIVREAREGALETPDQEDRVRWFEMELQPGVVRTKKIRSRAVRTFRSFILVCLSPMPHEPECSSDQGGQYRVFD